MLIQAAKFNTLQAATASADRAPRINKPVTFHGDDGLFWNVSGKDVQKLRAAGYEQA